MSQPFISGGQSIGASTSASVLPMSIHGWFPLGWTGLISLLSKGLSRIFSNSTVRKHQFLGAQPFYGPTLTSMYNYWKNHSFDYMDVCWQSDVSAFNKLSNFVIALLPRNNYLLILWLQSPSALILEPKNRNLTVSTFFPIYLP